ncbi:MAG: cyclodeaminase/cyclohydrolase family protein [Eggerthellaceae bacterium]|jgi:formiminotetrahydrofolate cyclodeaminase
MNSDFAERLASKDPTPGGGGASAYVGALSAALASMVGNLTVGKKKYAAYEDEVKASLERLEDIRAHLLDLIDEDAQAFEPLARVYGMPKGTEEEKAARDAALQDALQSACSVPLEIMRVSAQVLCECEILAHKGSRLALSDVGVSVVFARAAVHGASMNVIINLRSMTDTNQASTYRSEMDELIHFADEKAGSLYAYVVREIS